MTDEELQTIHDGFRAIGDELRSQRSKLDTIIKLLGGKDAKVQAIREDVSALQEQGAKHERWFGEVRRAR